MKGRELLPHEISPEKKEEKTGIGDTTHASSLNWHRSVRWQRPGTFCVTIMCRHYCIAANFYWALTMHSTCLISLNIPNNNLRHLLFYHTCFTHEETEGQRGLPKATELVGRGASTLHSVCLAPDPYVLKQILDHFMEKNIFWWVFNKLIAGFLT